MIDGPLIVADANVYLDAVLHDNAKLLGDPPALGRVPSLPPRTVHPALHVLGVIRDATDTGVGPALAISDHILLMVVHALRSEGWQAGQIRAYAYAYALRALAERSTGGYHADVPRTQHDCADYEDNLILDLAVHVDADLVVTNDSDLLQLGRVRSWKGRPIVTPDRFVGLADGAARRRRR
jgi:hypothetical protein